MSVYPERSPMPASRVRESFSDTLDRVAFGGERVVLQRHGKDIAALVPIADLDLLEELEDRDDLRAMQDALAESPVRKPFEQVRKELGLDKP